MAIKSVCFRNPDTGEYETKTETIPNLEYQAMLDEQSAESVYKASPEYEEEVMQKEAGTGSGRFRKLLFELNFDQENRIRVLEGKATITKLQYWNAIKSVWRTL